MFIGILQFELHIAGAESLKDKRRVVRSIKDRLHREHMVSLAEVGALETLNQAVMALACVGREGARVGEVLDHVMVKLRRLHDAELVSHSRRIMRDEEIEARAQDDPEERRRFDRQMLDYFHRGAGPALEDA